MPGEEREKVTTLSAWVRSQKPPKLLDLFK
jgi:hypothetical protein